MKRVSTVLALIILAALCACSNSAQTDAAPTPGEGMSLPRMLDEGEISEIKISPAGYIHDIAANAAGYVVTTFLDDGGAAAQYDQTGKMLWEYRYAGAGNPTVTVLAKECLPFVKERANSHPILLAVSASTSPGLKLCRMW